MTQKGEQTSRCISYNVTRMMLLMHDSSLFCWSSLLLFAVTLSSPTTAIATTNHEARVLLSWLQTMESPPPGFSSWSSSNPNPCLWSYVSCSPESHVTEIVIPPLPLSTTFPAQFTALPFLTKLVMSGGNLTGEVSPMIGNLTSLTVLDLSSNSLGGKIPPELGKLGNLEVLSLNSNHLVGPIPLELLNCSRLRVLNVVDNHLAGRIPSGFGGLSRLEVLRIGGNPGIEGGIPDDISNCQNLVFLGLAATNVSGRIPASLGRLGRLQTLAIYTTMISGEIPPEIGNCSELVNVFLYQNHLSGPIPAELGQCQKLEQLLLWQNELVGEMPSSFGNLTELKMLDLSLNSLSGHIPLSVSNLGKLTTFLLSGNAFTGSIPSVIGNCTCLSQLELDNNQLSGEIPPEIGQLKELTQFFTWQNLISGGIPVELTRCSKLKALDLSHNRLTGFIPPGLFQLKNLTKLLLISNNLSGQIPPDIGNCSSLVRLRLGSNQLSGVIPASIGMLGSLNFLELSQNSLSGLIPPEIGNCMGLEMIDFHGNRIQGSIPPSLVSILGLHVIDLSMNRISGSIPDSFGRLKYLNKLTLKGNFLSGLMPKSLGLCSDLQFLDLSSNRISGPIPRELGDLQNLAIALNLSWNHFSGSIPSTFSGFSNLANLDLSHNKLEGKLEVLAGLTNLVSLNVSFNNFSGLLPDTELFRELPQSVLEGNAGLCIGGHDCFAQGSETKDLKAHVKSFRLVIALLFCAMLLVVISTPMLINRARAMAGCGRYGGLGGDWKVTLFQRVNLSLDEVLMGLVEENVVGKGYSGMVYRVETGTGMAIAVKKLWPLKNENSSDRDLFHAEIKTLGLIRHRNIIRLLGFCTNANTRLLMYDYMQNGSLSELLHEKKIILDWQTRYKIMLGVAQGLAYLHHDCSPSIIHRDIKANNILISLDFEACVADFGLAKHVVPSEHTNSSHTVAGTYGYIAPEYGCGMKITEKSDVYSYGVLLLEVLTGMQPNDARIPEGMHIVNWIWPKLQTEEATVMDVLDDRLRGLPNSQIGEMFQALAVAILCVNSRPEERPTMKDVTVMLKEIVLESEECFTKTEKIIEVMSRVPPSYYTSFSRSSEALITPSLYSTSSSAVDSTRTM